MDTQQPNSEPFYTSGVSWMYITLSILFFPLLSILIFHQWYIIVTIYLLFAFLTLSIWLRRFMLFEDRIEITYPLKIRKNEVIPNNEVEKIKFSRSRSSITVEFELKGNGVIKRRRSFDVSVFSWVKEMKLLHEKYGQLGITVQIDSHIIKKGLGLKEE